ncbi:MAG: DUF6049 family protein [Frankia sp.]
MTSAAARRSRAGAAVLAAALVVSFIVVSGGLGALTSLGGPAGRWALAGQSVAQAAPTPSPTGSSTGSSTGAAPDEPATVRLTNFQKDSASPLTVAGVITMKRTTVAPTATNIVVRLGLGDPVDTRGEFTDLRTHPADPINTTAIAKAQLAPSPAGGQEQFTFPAISLPSLLPPSKFQVYPVSVTVSGTLAGTSGTLARTVAFLVWAPTGTVSTKTGVALVLPLADTPHLAASGTSLLDNALAAEIAPGGRLATLLKQVAPSHGVAPAVSLAVDPETARAIALMAAGPYRVAQGGHTVVHPRDPNAVAFLGNLKTFAAAKGSVLALPYGDPDVVALTRARQYYQIVAAILRGSEVLGEAMGGTIRPTGTVALPPDGLSDEATLDILRRAVPGNGGVRTVLLSGRALPPAPTETATPPAAVTVEAGKGTLRAVVADGDLAAVAAGGENRPAIEARQDYFAETAMITREEPSARDQLIVLPRRWNPSPAQLQTVFSDLTTRWSAAVPLRRVTDAEGPASDRSALTYPATARAAELAPSALASTAELRNQVVALHAVLCPATGTAASGGSAASPTPSSERPSTTTTRGDGSGTATAGTPSHPATATPTAPPVPITAAGQLSCSKKGSIASMMDALVASESAFFRGNPAGATALRQQVSSELDGLRDGIRLVASQKVTLTSRKGRVPVTLENDLSQAVSVQLALSTPDKARLGSASVVLRTIGPKQKVQVDIQVHAESAGSFPVYISLLTPEGDSFKPGPPSLVLVRSTAYGIIATAITVCALGVLALAVVVRSVRRVRAVRVARRESPARDEDGPTDVPGIRPAVDGSDRPTGGQR